MITTIIQALLTIVSMEQETAAIMPLTLTVVLVELLVLVIGVAVSVFLIV